jgi:hypothetical protein
MSKKNKKKKKVKLIPRNINKVVGSVKNLNTTTPGLFDYKKWEKYEDGGVKMISANEARKIIEENRLKLQKSIDEINYCINDAIYEGKFSIMLDGFISTETTEILKENGYKVNESDTHFQIIW